MTGERLRLTCGVIIPAHNRRDEVRSLVERLSADAPAETRIILIDDGSDPPLRWSGVPPAVEFLRFDRNRGVAAARNAGVARCRDIGVDVVVMIDSDCTPLNDVVAAHLALHAEHPTVAAIGGAIFGSGAGPWARLDGVMSWVHSMPYGRRHAVAAPYHLPTTNFSFKLEAVREFDILFDERLITGEDALFVRRLQGRGLTVLFSPEPEISHRDRTLAVDVVAHHFVWGYHQYFVQLGGDVSPRCFAPWYRSLFFCAFLPLAPIFALMGASLNLAPWLRVRPGHLVYFPACYIIWLLKALAVLRAALQPEKCLRRDLP